LTADLPERNSLGLPAAHLNQWKGWTNMKQLSTEQRLTRLIELKAQRDEIDREIAVLLGDAPAPGRTRSSERVMRSGNSQTVSQSKTAESAEGTDPNGSGS
jgi:hypothetical protein